MVEWKGSFEGLAQLPDDHHGNEDDNVFLESFDRQFEGSWWQVGWYTSIRLEQYNFKLLS